MNLLEEYKKMFKKSDTDLFEGIEQSQIIRFYDEKDSCTMILASSFEIEEIPPGPTVFFQESIDFKVTFMTTEYVWHPQDIVKVYFRGYLFKGLSRVEEVLKTVDCIEGRASTTHTYAFYCNEIIRAISSE